MSAKAKTEQAEAPPKAEANDDRPRVQARPYVEHDGFLVPKPEPLSSIRRELAAMAAVSEALEGLEAESARRVLDWVVDVMELGGEGVEN